MFRTRARCCKKKSRGVSSAIEQNGVRDEIRLREYKRSRRQEGAKRESENSRYARTRATQRDAKITKCQHHRASRGLWSNYRESYEQLLASFRFASITKQCLCVTQLHVPVWPFSPFALFRSLYFLLFISFPPNSSILPRIQLFFVEKNATMEFQHHAMWVHFSTTFDPSHDCTRWRSIPSPLRDVRTSGGHTTNQYVTKLTAYILDARPILRSYQFPLSHGRLARTFATLTSRSYCCSMAFRDIP